MINRLTLFLGQTRLQAIFLLLAITGLISLILNSIEAEWVVGVQSLLVLIFIGGTLGIVFSAMTPFDRGRWIGILIPAFGLIVLGVVFLPNLLPVLTGAAIGWIAAGMFIFRPRGPIAYQKAVKALRKNDYETAIATMTEMIKDEPKKANHYRFRAELYRLWGKLDRAKRDYRKMVELEPDSAVAYNGLAEVNLQAGAYQQALEAGQKAYELAPDEWVAAYNLGMIEDRLHHSEKAIDHLNEALTLKVPDIRHRLLIHFYILRAYLRLGDMTSAERELENLRKNQKGIKEWSILFESEQSATLRAVIYEDVHTAELLLDNQLKLSDLAIYEQDEEDK